MKKRCVPLIAALLAAALLAACAQPTPAPAPRETAQQPEATLPPEDAPPPAQEDAPAPFTNADVQAIAAGYPQVADYVNALDPREFTWEYEGDATGNTYITMFTYGGDGTLLGSVTVVAATEDGLIFDEEDGQGGILPDAVMALPAWLAEAEWLAAAYPLPAIRGVGIGAQSAEVVAAFYSHGEETPAYTAGDINPAVDESWELDEYQLIGAEAEIELGEEPIFRYGWATLNEPEEWREYYTLEYTLQNGLVESIVLAYDCDPE